MKAGWKTRIDERRYFEEKRRTQNFFAKQRVIYEDSVEEFAAITENHLEKSARELEITALLSQERDKPEFVGDWGVSVAALALLAYIAWYAYLVLA